MHARRRSLWSSAWSALAAGLAFAAAHSGWVVAQSPSPVTLPSGYVDTNYALPTGCDVVGAGTPLSGGCKIITVDAGQSFQTALDMARRGDVIQLAANATFIGPFELPDKGAGTGWVYVVSSALGSLPGPGARLNPALGGSCGTEGALPCDVTPNAALSDMPKIMTGGCDPCRWLTTAHGADRYRFIGIEFKVTPGDFVSVGIRLYQNLGFAQHGTLAQKTSDIIFDRCLMRGQRTAPFSGRPIAINGNRHAVINSYLSDWVDDDSDTQAVLISGYASVFAVVNNYLEATGENVYTDNTEVIDGEVYTPSDGEIRGNYLRKLAEWNSKSPSWNNIKNQFEMKSGQRILFEGNVVDTTYHMAQETSINIKIGDEDALKFVNNVTIRKNLIRHTANGIKVCATQCNSGANTNIISGVAVYNNIFDHVSSTFGDGGDGNGFLHIVTGPKMFVDHNTFINQNEGIYLFARGNGVSNGQTLALTNNIWHFQANPLTLAEVTGVSSVASYTNNLIVGGNCSSYPAGNRCPATWAEVGFANFRGGNGGDYTLGAASAYKGGGSDALGVGTTDPGANISAVNAATACAVSGQCTGGGGGRGAGAAGTTKATPRGDMQRVSWMDLVNAKVYLWNLRKTDGCDDCADAGGMSSQRIIGDGYVEVEVSSSQKAYYIGLGPGSPGTSPVDVDFGLRVNGLTADVHEANTPKASVPVSDSDLLRVSVKAGVVNYLRNGAVFYTSQRSPIFPLSVRAVLLDQKAEVRRAYIWRQAASVTSAASSLNKVASTGGTPAKPVDRASPLSAWAFGLASRAESSVVGIYVYAQLADGSSETPVFLGAFDPTETRSFIRSLVWRARLSRALADLGAGVYTVTAFAQSDAGAPVAIGTTTVVVR